MHTPLVSPTTIATFVAALLVTLIGIPAATRVARALGKKDPSIVVIDEVAGQLVTLIACPLFTPDVISAYLGVPTWKPALAALILFRAFDILKPPPIRMLDRRWKNGWGVMADDLLAAGYTLLVLALWRHYRS